MMTPGVKSAPTVGEISDRSWMEQSACRGVDTEAWFTPKPPKQVRLHIAEVCSTCPVTLLCLSYAIVHDDEFGAWGGYLAGDLLPLRRRFASGESLSSVLNLGTPQAGSRRGLDAA